MPACRTLDTVSVFAMTVADAWAIYEVFDTDDRQIEPVPMLGTRVRADFLAGMTRARGQVIGVLNLPRVLSAVDLASLIASHQPARAA